MEELFAMLASPDDYECQLRNVSFTSGAEANFTTRPRSMWPWPLLCYSKAAAPKSCGETKGPHQIHVLSVLRVLVRHATCGR
jgi:hypothetical protein